MLYNGLTNNPWERAAVTHPYAYWDNAFTPIELTKIITYCEDQGLERAQILGADPSEKATTEEIRRCDIKFHQRNENTGWIFDRLNGVISTLNNMFYGFDLNGYDAFQYTSYSAAEAGTYHWHMDTCLGRDHLPPNMTQPRKLSLTMLVNDPETDFEGGEFMINLGNEKNATTVPFKLGRIAVFPSFMIHSVKPVTKGCRKSIVIWVSGPKWK